MTSSHRHKYNTHHDHTERHSSLVGSRSEGSYFLRAKQKYLAFRPCCLFPLHRKNSTLKLNHVHHMGSSYHDSIMTKRFSFDSVVASGVFGTVYAGYDRWRKDAVAIKVMRIGEMYEAEGRREARVMRRLQNHKRSTCLQSQSCIIHHIAEYVHTEMNARCLVYEYMDENLRTFLRQHEKKYVPLFTIRRICRCLVRALCEMHGDGDNLCDGVIHGDIKPENIVLQQTSTPQCDAAYKDPNHTDTCFSHNDSYQTYSCAKLVDFGSAFEKDRMWASHYRRHSRCQNHKKQAKKDATQQELDRSHVQKRACHLLSPISYVQTRYYRSPETVLRLPWNEKIDIWSLGCVAAELHHGYPLFPAQDEKELVGMWQRVLGPLPRDETVMPSPKKSELFLDPSTQKVKCSLRRLRHLRSLSELFQVSLPHISELTPEQETKQEESIQDSSFYSGRPPPPPSSSRWKEETARSKDYVEFLDFLRCCLAYTPMERSSARELRGHPFLHCGPEN